MCFAFLFVDLVFSLLPESSVFFVREFVHRFKFVLLLCFLRQCSLLMVGGGALCNHLVHWGVLPACLPCLQSTAVLEAEINLKKQKKKEKKKV